MSLKKRDNIQLEGHQEFQIIDWAESDLNFDPNEIDEIDDNENGEEDEEDIQYDDFGNIEKKKKNKVKRYCIRAYGINDKGNKILIFIIGFKPFFYVKIPQNWSANELTTLKNVVFDKLNDQSKKTFNKIEIVYKKEFYGFTANAEFKFLKISCLSMQCFKSLIEIFSNTIKLNKKQYKLPLYESNVTPLLRFLHIKDISPSGWVSFDKYENLENDKSRCNSNIMVKWNNIHKSEKTEICPLSIASFDIECTSHDGSFPLASIKEDRVIQIGTTFHYYGEKSCYLHHIVTLKNCSEITASEVDAKEVIVESCDNEKDVILKWCELINKTDPDIITGYNIHGFDFNYIYQRANTGNGKEVFPYIEQVNRLLARNKDIKIGYLKNEKRFVDKFYCEYKEKGLKSAALGDNILKYFDIEGIVSIDLMKVVQKDFKLESYKLDNVAYQFTKQNKVDLPPKLIFQNYNKGDSESIKEIAVYCLKDCELVNKLIMKLEIIANNIGMSNVCVVPFSYLFQRGQGIKIYSLVAKYCSNENFVIKLQKVNEDDTSGYEGAIVFPPKVGIHFEPVGVNDYASLYPSSMIAENISHDSIVWVKKYDIHDNLVDKNGIWDNKKNDWLYDNLEDYNYNEIEFDNLEKYNSKIHKKEGSDFLFFKDVFGCVNKDKVKLGKFVCRYAEHKDGSKNVLPRILQKLLKARKDTRKKIPFKTVITKQNGEFGESINQITYEGLYNAKDKNILLENGKKIDLSNVQILSVEDTYNSFQKAILDGLQLAYKVTCNSLYGQVGARTSPIYYKELAACTTATGRKMTLTAKDKILEKFPGSELIYGDTDSVFISYVGYIKSVHGDNLTDEDLVKYTFQYGTEAGEYVTSLLKRPQNLEWEKVMWPFVIFSKKRYVANKYESAKFLGLDKFSRNSMGIVLKRRDNAQILKDIYGNIIEIIMTDKDIEKAKDFFKSSIENLFKGNIDLKKLSISKSLKSTYANPTAIAHKVLADRIKERDPGNAPMSGDRLAYCYINFNNLECKVCGKKKLNPEYCKCRKCGYIYCSNHMPSHKEYCEKKCRFCKVTDKQTKLIFCNTCFCLYCPDDFAKHKIRIDKYKQEHNDKCKKKLQEKNLQGDIIETIDYIKQKNLDIDYMYYWEHQIKVPCLQIFELVMKDPESLVRKTIQNYINKLNGQGNIMDFFKKMEQNKKLENQNDIDSSVDIKEINEIEDDIEFTIEESNEMNII